MRGLIVGLTLALAAVLTACSGGGAKGPTEASLRAQVAEMNEAFKDKDFTKLYSYMSPTYREACALSDFLGTMLLIQAFGGESYFKADMEISDLKITGTEATYTVTTILDGAVLNKGDVKVTYVKGKWVDLADDTDTSQCKGA